jgi:Ca-activated chloride channel family protein
MLFHEIRYLWLLVTIPCLVLVSLGTYRKSNRWLYSFARRQKKRGAFVLTTLLFSFSLVALTISLAEPKVQYEKIYFNRAGIELVMGIDISKSMLAEDVPFPPEGKKLFNVLNRLNSARYFALNTISELRGERIGAFICASMGIEIVPFTRDYAFCRYIIKHINDAEITVPGSDLGEAVKTGIGMLEASEHGAAKAIILVSDGEDITLDKSSLYESAQIAADKRIKIYTVGVGTGKGVLIPIRSEDGATILDYYVGEDGLYLKTRLVQETLKRIATMTGGQYFRADEEGAPEDLIKAILQHAKGVEATQSVELAWLDLSPFFLLVGLGSFLLGALKAG